MRRNLKDAFPSKRGGPSHDFDDNDDEEGEVGILRREVDGEEGDGEQKVNKRIFPILKLQLLKACLLVSSTMPVRF